MNFESVCVLCVCVLYMLCVAMIEHNARDMLADCVYGNIENVETVH